MTLRQKKLFRITTFHALAILVASCVAILVNGYSSPNDLDASATVQQVPAISTDIDTTWRYTKDGWQDASMWQVRDSFSPIRTFELVHPFVWAMIVLLAVVSTLVWASNESEIAGLFSKQPTFPDHDPRDSIHS